MKRFFLFGMVTLLLSCGTGFKKDRHTFYFALSGEPNYLNWVPYSSGYESDVIQFLYQPIMDADMNNNMKLIPALAKSIKASPDKRTYTVIMRKDQLWQDKQPVTAFDAQFTYNKVMDPKSGAQNKIAGFENSSFKLINKFSFSISFKTPKVTDIYTVAGLVPIPRHIWQGKSMRDPNHNRKPIGNGPFKLLSWRTGRSIILVRNKLYKNKPTPFFKKIIFKIIPESAAQIAALRKGTIDFVERVRPVLWKKFNSSKRLLKKFQPLKYDSTSYALIAWQANGKNPYFNNKYVRQAMTHCLNRKTIIKRLRKGLAAIQSGPFYPTSWANDPSVKPLAYNPKKAALLLDKAGWKKTRANGLRQKNGKPFSFTFLVPQGSTTGQEIATILQSELKKIGVQMLIRTIEWSVFNKKLNNRDFEACTFSWNNTVDPDVYDLWHSSLQTKGLNLVGYNNPKVDKLLENARTAFNPQRRKKISHQIHRIINQEQPYTFLYAAYGLDLFDRRIQGVKTSLRGPFYAWPGLAGWSVGK